MDMETAGWKRGNGIAKIGKKKLHAKCKQIMPIQPQEPFPPLLKIWPDVGHSHTNNFLLLSYKDHHISSLPIPLLECGSGY